MKDPQSKEIEWMLGWLEDSETHAITCYRLRNHPAWFAELPVTVILRSLRSATNLGQWPALSKLLLDSPLIELVDYYRHLGPTVENTRTSFGMCRFRLKGLTQSALRGYFG